MSIHPLNAAVVDAAVTMERGAGSHPPASRAQIGNAQVGRQERKKPLIRRATAGSARGNDVVVGYKCRRSGYAPLRKAIDMVRAESRLRLVVVHVAALPVKVHNGPSAAVAESLGSPDWATMHSTVIELGAEAERTLTIVESGESVAVLARHSDTASILLLGSERLKPRRRGHFHRLSAMVGCPVEVVPTAKPTSKLTLSMFRFSGLASLSPEVLS